MIDSSKAPLMASLTDDKGLLAKAWSGFYKLISDCLDYIGQERAFTLVNNQGSAADITGMVFDYAFTSFASIEYVIQRTTSTTEKLQSGILHAVFKPKSIGWSLREYGTSGPDASGITFSITGSGQVQYTSTNLGGTPGFSRIVYRVRKIAAKSAVYSRVR